jgi:hypothetical protein
MRPRHDAPRRTTASQFGALTALCAAAAPLGVVLALVMSEPSLADESGASMYLPGSFASLAAVPAEPGWSLALVYYHGKGTFGPPSVGYATERSDLGYGAPTYAFATPVLGGQLALSMVGAIGRIQASIDSVADDRRYGYNDLLPGATLRWSSGVNNYMVYGLGEIPSGTYDPLRLANFGIGHGGIDVGGGYTYFDQKAGYEFSAVAGITYNLKNPSTEYQNGIDSHIDWGVSRFLSKDFHIGAVGYYYEQLTADRGQPAVFGDFKSRVAAVGPQMGYFFPIGDAQGYVNLKAYSEFAAQNRPAGLNAWLTLVFSPKAEAPPPRLGRPPLGH